MTWQLAVALLILWTACGGYAVGRRARLVSTERMDATERANEDFARFLIFVLAPLYIVASICFHLSTQEKE